MQFPVHATRASACKTRWIFITKCVSACVSVWNVDRSNIFKWLFLSANVEFNYAFQVQLHYNFYDR